MTLLPYANPLFQPASLSTYCLCSALTLGCSCARSPPPPLRVRFASAFILNPTSNTHPPHLPIDSFPFRLLHYGSLLLIHPPSLRTHSRPCGHISGLHIFIIHSFNFPFPRACSLTAHRHANFIPPVPRNIPLALPSSPAPAPPRAPRLCGATHPRTRRAGAPRA